jgi:addiction module HigA family antidote
MNIQKRKPAHPGRILKNLYLKPLSLTITKLSEIIGVSRKAVSAIVNQRKSVTPEMALRLSQALKTSPDLWLNLQKNYDLWLTINKSKEWKKIKPIPGLSDSHNEYNFPKESSMLQ